MKMKKIIMRERSPNRRREEERENAVMRRRERERESEERRRRRRERGAERKMSRGGMSQACGEMAMSQAKEGRRER